MLKYIHFYFYILSNKCINEHTYFYNYDKTRGRSLADDHVLFVVCPIIVTAHLFV